MKKVMLAPLFVRICCIISDAFFLMIVIVWLMTRFSWIAVLIVGLVATLLCFYNIQIFGSAILVSKKDKTITVTGIQKHTYDISNAYSIFTRETKIMGHTTRIIIIEDKKGEEISRITTLNNMNSGYACERVAQQLGQLLDIPFHATVPRYLYDAKERWKRQQQQKRQKKSQEGRGPTASKNPENGQETRKQNYDEADDGPEK